MGFWPVSMLRGVSGLLAQSGLMHILFEYRSLLGSNMSMYRLRNMVGEWSRAVG